MSCIMGMAFLIQEVLISPWWDLVATLVSVMLMDWLLMDGTLLYRLFKTIYDWARKHVLGSVTVGQTGAVQYIIHTPSCKVCLEIKITKLPANLTRDHVLSALQHALSDFPETLEAEKKAFDYHKMVREFHAACLNAATARVKGDKSSQWLEESFLFLRKLKQELSAQGSALGLSEEVLAMDIAYKHAAENLTSSVPSEHLGIKEINKKHAREHVNWDPAFYHKMVGEFHAACLNGAIAKEKGDKSREEEADLLIRNIPVVCSRVI